MCALLYCVVFFLICASSFHVDIQTQFDDMAASKRKRLSGYAREKLLSFGGTFEFHWHSNYTSLMWQRCTEKSVRSLVALKERQTSFAIRIDSIR